MLHIYCEIVKCIRISNLKRYCNSVQKENRVEILMRYVFLSDYILFWNHLVRLALFLKIQGHL